MAEFEPGGWPDHLENREAIAAMPDDSACSALYGTYNEVKFDPRKVIKLENQKSLGSCAGHSGSTTLEWIRTIATGVIGHQLSRGGFYFETQRRDGINGDKGSTIENGYKLAKEWGCCDESLWPYPSRYDNRRPDNWDAVCINARKNKISTGLRVTSYESGRVFLGSGQGGIHLGIGWNSSVDRGLVERYSNSGGGGHALAALCLSDRLDDKGRPFWWIANSWSERWGQDGWAEWSPTAVSGMLQSRRTVMIAMSDMPAVKPRTFDVSDWKNALEA